MDEAVYIVTTGCWQESRERPSFELGASRVKLQLNQEQRVHVVQVSLPLTRSAKRNPGDEQLRSLLGWLSRSRFPALLRTLLFPLPSNG